MSSQYFAVEAGTILVLSLPGCISSGHIRWDEIQSIWCGFIIALLLTQNGCGPAQTFHQWLILHSG